MTGDTCFWGVATLTGLAIFSAAAFLPPLFAGFTGVASLTGDATFSAAFGVEADASVTAPLRPRLTGVLAAGNSTAVFLLPRLAGGDVLIMGLEITFLGEGLAFLAPRLAAGARLACLAGDVSAAGSTAARLLVAFLGDGDTTVVTGILAISVAATSLAGVLTAFAGVLTALTGLALAGVLAATAGDFAGEGVTFTDVAFNGVLAGVALAGVALAGVALAGVAFAGVLALRGLALTVISLTFAGDALAGV